MDQIKISNVDVKSRTCDVSFNGEKYRVAYDSYMGDYRFYKGDKYLNGPYGRYYYGDESIKNGDVFNTRSFKEGFITERVYEEFKRYNFRLLYRRKGNEYISPDGVFVKNVRNCESAFFHNGKYWYLSIGADGYPTVEKSFTSLNEIKRYVAGLKHESPTKSSSSAGGKSIIAGALTVGGLALAKIILDKNKKNDQ